jgi:tRNA A-37 threonylcarbamoyl transferase component Bud32
MSNLTGQTIGRYHILEQLGEGGMATVYKAYDTRLERDVAIKVIRRDAFPPNQLDHILKRFEREAKALARLAHPNIVGVIDYGEHEGAPYLVMVYLRGGTLKQRLGKPVAWQEAAQMLTPIAEALEYAHENHIVHRDIKPANILLTEKGQPMLTDFGIAKLLEGSETQTLTGTGAAIGTPEYMAPEQWTGQAVAQSDIYSLGVVLYELVTGRKPYIADTPAAVFLKQVSDPLPRPKFFMPGLPDAVEHVLLKALAKKPEDRYQSIGEFATALKQLVYEGGQVAQKKQVPQAPVQPEHVDMATVQFEETTDELRTVRQVEPVQTTRLPARPERKGFSGWVWVLGIVGGMCLLITGALFIGWLSSLTTATPVSVYVPATTEAPAATKTSLPPPTDVPEIKYRPVGKIVIDPSFDSVPRSVVFQDPYAYVLTREGLLLVYDLSGLGEQSDQQFDIVVGRASIANADGLVAIGSSIYIFGTYFGLAVLDVSDPTNPTLGQYFSDYSFANLSFDPESGIVAASGYHKIAIFNRRESGDLELISAQDFSENENFWSVATIGNTLFAGGWVDNGGTAVNFLREYDMSDPYNLREINTWEMDTPYHILILNRQRALVCGDSDISLWNISNLEQPVVVVKIGGGSRLCELDGDHLLVSDGRVYKISDSGLTEIAAFPSISQSDGFPYFGSVSENIVLLPDWDNVVILRRYR